jgi:hypothetical protein
MGQTDIQRWMVSIWIWLGMLKLAVRGNLGKYFLCKGLVTKNGLRHEEKLDWFLVVLGTVDISQIVIMGCGILL